MQNHSLKRHESFQSMTTEQQANNDEDDNLVNQNYKDQKVITRIRMNNDTNKPNQFSFQKILILLIVLIAIAFFINSLETLGLQSQSGQIKTGTQSQVSATELKSGQSQNLNQIVDTKQKLNEQENEQFQMNFIQTDFQGKQTELKLALASSQKAQTQRHKNPSSKQNQNQQERKKLLQDLSMLEEMIPDRSVPQYTAPNFYFFSASIHEIILNSQLDKMYRKGRTIYKITLKQHIRAIIRTQLVHNVNFKGQIQAELTPFDKNLQQKTKAIKQIMQDEELYYESFYQLSKYNKYQLRFCILVPSYKNVKSQLYLRNLDSIFMQDYQNYHIVYIDDASPDQTGEFVKKYLKDKNIPDEKIQVHINDINKKALYNIYHGIHNYCPDGQIVGLIDGDDSLLGRKVLQLYNAVYQSKKSALVYSNFLKLLTNNKTSFGFGTEVTKSYYGEGKLRNDMTLVGTHFMTFFSDIFKKIHKEDLCYQNGTFYDYAYDRAIITPMIQMAFPRVEYLTQITYEYRNDTGINDGTEDWERVSKIILAKPAYSFLGNYPFIDNFLLQKQKLLQIQRQKQLRSFGINIFQPKRQQNHLSVPFFMQLDDKQVPASK